MTSYISFPEDNADIEVSIEINAKLSSIVSLLMMMKVWEDTGLDEVIELNDIYESIIMQVSQYGNIDIDGDDEDV